jgi:putative colanic acid biosynthesis glycosyltransferase WcaI
MPMRISVLTQVYWPDDVSTAQHLVDLCEELVGHDAEVEVIASYRKYEDRSVKFPLREIRNGVKIRRLRDTGFGKKTMPGRILDFASYNFLLFFKILFGKKPDIYLGMTSPPLVSFVGAFVARIRGARFCYWTMDLQPELSIRSGLVKESSLSAKTLVALGDYIFRRADNIVVLDKYMKEHAIDRGASPSAISVVPVWPVMNKIYVGKREENPFRLAHGFGDKLVVMYSGNHSYVHPLDTILDVALKTRDNDQILYVFIGGGVRAKDVTQFRDKHDLENIVKLPYQPRESIHLSLGASDVQLVVMGDDLTGYTHPNKIYGAMFIGKPVVYIGPTPSHVSDILENLNDNVIVNHGDIDLLVENLENLQKLSTEERECIGNSNREYALSHFAPDVLKELMSDAVLRESSTAVAL